MFLSKKEKQIQGGKKKPYENTSVLVKANTLILGKRCSDNSGSCAYGG